MRDDHDLRISTTTGSAGIGLFRTELQFMVGTSCRDDRSAAAVRRGARPRPKPVTFRTLDIAATGAALYETVTEEIRAGLARHPARSRRPGLLRGQIRALLRAGGGRALRISSDDFGGGRIRFRQAIIERELIICASTAMRCRNASTSAMVEVTALLYQLDEPLRRSIRFGRFERSISVPVAVDAAKAKSFRTVRHQSAPSARVARDRAQGRRRQKIGALCAKWRASAGRAGVIAPRLPLASLSATAHGPQAMVLDLDAKKAAAMIAPLLDAPYGQRSDRARLKEFASDEGLVVASFARMTPPSPFVIFETSHVDLAEAKLESAGAPRSLEAEIVGPIEFRKICANFARACRTQSADRRGKGVIAPPTPRSPASIP